MARWKVLIAEPSPELSDAMAKALENDFRVVCCARGDEALRLIRSELPDVVILELALAGLDGISVLRRLPQRPPVLVVSDLLTPYVIGVLESLGIQYAMRKPVSLSNLTDRVLELACLSKGLGDVGNALELLRRMSVPSGRQGFQHLLLALQRLTDQRDQRMGKELYLGIAKQFSTSVCAVEKGIRDVIQAGWDRGYPGLWKDFFPEFTKCPSNKEFLFRIADHLGSWRKCG